MLAPLPKLCLSLSFDHGSPRRPSSAALGSSALPRTESGSRGAPADRRRENRGKKKRKQAFRVFSNLFIFDLDLDLNSPSHPPHSLTSSSSSSSLRSRKQVLWQLIDDGDVKKEEASVAKEKAAGAEEATTTTAATTKATAATATADASLPAPAKDEPHVVWWAATIESLAGDGGGSDPGSRLLRATLRYEAKPELGFEAETATVEFSNPSSPPPEDNHRELRNVGEDGQLTDEVALPWRFLGEGDDEDEEEEAEEEEEGMEEEEEEETAAVASAAAFPTSAEVISASDLEKTLSAQLNSLERVTGLKAEAAGAAALLAGAGGSSSRAAEVAIRFEAFGESLRERLAAAARANGGAALGAEEVREAVAEARRSAGGGGGGGV